MCLLCFLPFLPSPEVLNSRWYLGVFFFFVCFEFVAHEVSLHSMRVHVSVLDSQLTTALIPTVPPLCFLVQSKVRDTFWHLICPYALHDQQVFFGG